MLLLKKILPIHAHLLFLRILRHNSLDHLLQSPRRCIVVLCLLSPPQDLVRIEYQVCQPPDFD